MMDEAFFYAYVVMDAAKKPVDIFLTREAARTWIRVSFFPVGVRATLRIRRARVKAYTR